MQLASRSYDATDISAVQELYHSNGWTAAPVVIWHQNAPAQGLHAQSTEEFAAHVNALHCLSLTPTGEIENGERPS